MSNTTEQKLQKAFMDLFTDYSFDGKIAFPSDRKLITRSQVIEIIKLAKEVERITLREQIEGQQVRFLERGSASEEEIEFQIAYNQALEDILALPALAPEEGKELDEA